MPLWGIRWERRGDGISPGRRGKGDGRRGVRGCREIERERERHTEETGEEGEEERENL